MCSSKENYDLELSVDDDDVHLIFGLANFLYIPILKIVVGLVLNHNHPLIANFIHSDLWIISSRPPDNQSNINIA